MTSLTLKPPLEELLTYTGLENRLEEVVVAGSHGSGNDVSLVQDAVNNFAYDKTVILEGDFNFTGDPAVTLPSGAHVMGRPGATITKSSSGNTNVFEAQGSIATAINLTANATLGATTLTLPTTGLVVGDWLLLRSNVDWSAFEVGAPQGELVRIRTITDSGHLETMSALRDSYTTANTGRVAKVTFCRDVRLSGVRHLNDTLGTGNIALLNSRYTMNLRIENVAAERMTGASLYLESGLGTVVDGGYFLDGYTREDAGSGAYGYGVDLVGATQGATISDITGHNGRVLTTTNGSPRGGVPRDCTISDSTVSGRYSVSGFHTHYVAENIKYSDCIGTGQFSGGGLFHIAGKNCTISDGQGMETIGSGVYVDTSAVNTTIVDCIFRNIRGDTEARAVKDTGLNTRVIGGLFDGAITANELVYTEGDGFLISGTTLIPGAGKHGLTTWDNSDSWFAINVTIITANIGINYGTVGGTVTPTPRVVGLKTYSVTTPITSALGLVSRENISATPVAVFGGAVLMGTTTGGGEAYIEGYEQTVDPAAPTANGARLFFKDNGAGKTQLIARFNTGANVVIATQP